MIRLRLARRGKAYPPASRTWAPRPEVGAFRRRSESVRSILALSEGLTGVTLAPMGAEPGAPLLYSASQPTNFFCGSGLPIQD